MTARRVAFVGLRVAQAEVYAATVSLYRDAVGLDVVRTDGERSVRFRLGDGTGLHVYGPADTDHLEFGDRVCVGLWVDDVDECRRRLASFGIAIIDARDATGRTGGMVPLSRARREYRGDPRTGHPWRWPTGRIT
ncbi:MAG: hypothetical protein WKF78_04205 [Candidatus Limnocylindrales bacterium]